MSSSSYATIRISPDEQIVATVRISPVEQTATSSLPAGLDTKVGTHILPADLDNMVVEGLMDQASNGILPTFPPPPTSQRPPGHPVGEPGGRLHPPKSPNLQDLRSLVMGLLNARAMLESSFGKTEKVLDANKIKQLNSGCSDGCTENFGDDPGHDLAREAGGEVWGPRPTGG